MPAWADLDEPKESRSWVSFRNLSPASYQSKLDTYTAQGFRPVDVEIKGGTRPRYALIMRKNPTGTKWALHTTLNNKDFKKKLARYRKDGYRLIDQETYRRGGKRYYGGVWLKNTTGLKWASYRHMSSDAYHDMYRTLKSQGLMPIDVDAYTMNGKLRFSGVWVQQSEAKDWAVRRHLSSDAFSAEFKSYQKKGYRLYDTESYRFKKRQYFAAIWVKDKRARRWAAYRNLSDDEFHNKWVHFVDRGYRLVDVETYSVGTKKRYAGIWIQNNDMLDWQHRKSVQKSVETYRKAYPSAGLSVVVAHRGKVVFRQGWGHQTRRKKDAHSGTVYRLASISKALSGVLGFRLQKKGKISLSKTTRSYESRLPRHHSHTVLDLLANRGRVRHYDGKEPDHKRYSSAYKASAIFRNDPLVNDAYLYSTHGYTLVAAAYEGATGKNFCTLIRTYLADPNGLKTLRCENRKYAVRERATLYSVKSSGAGFRSVKRPENLSWKYAGGGLEASAYDIAKLGIALDTGKILSRAEITAMTTAPDRSAAYAYGWDVGTHKGRAYYEKRGDQEGGRSILRIYPDEDIVIVMMANTRGSSRKMRTPTRKIAERLF